MVPSNQPPRREKRGNSPCKMGDTLVSTKCAPMWNNVSTHSSHLYLSSYGFEEVYRVGQCLQVPCERRLFLPWDHRVSTIVTDWAPIQDYPFLGHCNYEMRWVTRGCVHFLDGCKMDMSMRLSPTIDGSHSFLKKNGWKGPSDLILTMNREPN